MILEKYSIGIGDRFGRQGKAQLKALLQAKKKGLDLVPVWNKSFREHQIIHSAPDEVRKEADEATQALSWKDSYYVDADHINLNTIDLFIEPCNFFSIDVADYIGKETSSKKIQAFLDTHQGWIGTLQIPGFKESLRIEPLNLIGIAQKYLLSIEEAAKIYRHIRNAKGEGNFIVEVSIDESAKAQTPLEMLFILSAIAREGILVQSIAPKFTGRFNKGVDYQGDLQKFASEFEEHLLILRYATEHYNLPANLKLSIHSGSDKFSLYPIIHAALKKYNAGLHLKTAGTTWLEELIGLAESEGEGLRIAQELYESALQRRDELCGPYASVIQIDPKNLPDSRQVRTWSGNDFSERLRHNPACKNYNPDFRQLLHVSYKLAAEMGDRFYEALDASRESIGRNVTENLFKRHIQPLFFGKG